MSHEEIMTRYLKHGVTDRNRTRVTDPGNPDQCQSVYPMHKIVTPGETETGTIAAACRNATIGCKACKELLVENLYKVLGPFQERRREFADKDKLVREILVEGGRRARAIIAPTVELAADRMGIHHYKPLN